MKRFVKILKIVAVCYVILLIFSTLTTKSEQKPLQAQNVQQVSYDIPKKEVIDANTIYTLVNNERNKAGAPLLARNAQLDSAATSKCNDMATTNYYSHVNPSGKHGYQFAQDAVANDKTVAENLNQGTYYTNANYITSWLNSPPHKAAMLDPQYVDTGVAVCKSNGLDTIVQFFVNYHPVQAPTSVRLKTTCFSTGGGGYVRGTEYIRTPPTGVDCY